MGIRDKHPGSATTVPLIKEVEKDSETAARTKLENMMTEAMIRTCPKCGNRSVGFSYIAVYGKYRYRTGTALSLIKIFCSEDTIVGAKKDLYMMTEAMIRTCPKCGNRSVGFSYSEYRKSRQGRH
jgi:predicted nucleic-acid-binding Zn-ribbon protein